MNKIPAKIYSQIHKVKTFGALGEQYEIVAALYPLKNDDWLMKIKLLDSGEFMMYRYSEILCDPLATKTEITRVPLWRFFNYIFKFCKEKCIMALLDASIDKTTKKAVTIFLDKNLLAEADAYCQWRRIKSVKEFMIKSMQYVLKNDKDWRKICLQHPQTNAEESSGD